MGKFEIDYVGQEISARKYLMSRDDYTMESVALMSSKSVEKELNKIAENEQMEYVYSNEREGFGLIPKELVDKINWFER